MRFPEWLYRLLPNDEGSQQLEVKFADNTATATSNPLGFTLLTVPKDKCFVLTNMSGKSQPGAGQFATRSRMLAQPPSPSNKQYTILEDQTDAAAGAHHAQNWQGEVVLGPGWVLRYECEWNSSVNPNLVEADCHGYMIPRGTFGISG